VLRQGRVVKVIIPRETEPKSPGPNL
jgi:hypothetical protein